MLRPASSWVTGKEGSNSPSVGAGSPPAVGPPRPRLSEGEAGPVLLGAPEPGSLPGIPDSPEKEDATGEALPDGHDEGAVHSHDGAG